MRGLVPLDNKIARMTVSFSNSAEFVTMGRLYSLKEQL